MPFKSDQQRKACFATDGFDGKVDCKAWAHKTKGKKLPHKVKKKKMTFEEYVQNRDEDKYYKWNEYDCPFCGGTAVNGDPYNYHSMGPFWFRGSARCLDCKESFGGAWQHTPKGKLLIEKKKWDQKAKS